MIPDDLLYTKTHEWVKVEGETALLGITDFAQQQLGDLTFIELPAPGDELSAGDEMGSIESVKAASEIYAPIDGEVLEINEDLEDAPELVNQDPYGEGWLVRVSLAAEPADLLTPEEYADLVESESE